MATAMLTLSDTCTTVCLFVLNKEGSFMASLHVATNASSPSYLPNGGVENTEQYFLLCQTCDVDRCDLINGVKCNIVGPGPDRSFECNPLRPRMMLI